MEDKDIIILKDIVNEYKDYFCGNYNIINDMELKLAHIEAIENLLEENRILKDNQTKIITDSFHEKMAEKFDEDFIPKTKYEKLKEKLKQAYNYVKEEMYIDENPTICGDENCTITKLPTSLCLCNEDLDKLLDLLKNEE